MNKHKYILLFSFAFVILQTSYEVLTSIAQGCGLTQIPAPTDLRLVDIDSQVPVQKDLLGISLPGDFSLFSPDSPWNTPVSSDSKLHPNSTSMINLVVKATPELKMSIVNWTTPMFVINSAASPKRQVSNPAEPLHPSVDPDSNGVAENIPLPDGIWPDPQTDGHMLLVDPKTCKSWELSRAVRLNDGNWQATRVAVWDLDGPGYDPAFNGPYWWMRGARGSGAPLAAGLIRPEEIQQGEIRHALSFAAVNIRKSTSSTGSPRELCSPVASRTDGSDLGADYMPMGIRIQLDPALDLDGLGLSSASKIVAKAMQVYGMFLVDGSSTLKIYLQNLGQDRGKWKDIGNFDDLSLIPVNRFRVLDCSIATK